VILDTHKFRLVILVVLYNKTPAESSTLGSLEKALHSLNTSYEEVQICFWNNGPEKINSIASINSPNYSATLVETINNESLSSIYNRFLEMYHSDKYLILDHDSRVSEGYLKECLIDQSDFSIPTIVTSHGIQSPKIYNLKAYEGTSTLLAIGSGICLTRKACNIVKSHFSKVFDERFYLYGVDSTFFLRLNKIGYGNKIQVSSNTIVHSLSKFEKEDSAIKRFREKERSYDQALTLRYYFSLFTAVTIFKKIIGCVFLNKSDINLFIFFSALISGKHYKSDKK
jgi:GT2 family glycosyltransferase